MIHGMRVLVAATLACAPVLVHAQRERYAPLIVQLPVSARSLALGGGVSTLRDAESVFGNPALVGGNNALSVSGGRYGSGASTGHASTTMSIGVLGIGFGVAMLDARLRFADFPARSAVLTTDGALASSSLAATVGASLVVKGIRWGGAVKYLEERWSDVRAGVVAADLGVSKDLRNGAFAAGLVVQNIGRPLQLGPSRAQLPMRVSLGVAGGGYAIGKYADAGASASVAVRRDGRVFPSGGSEFVFTPIEGISLATRVGARTPELRAQRPFTIGSGFTVDRLTIDYAWEDMRGKGGAHRVTLRLR